VTDERKEVQLPQGTIRYREAGQGKPIVFVHGYLVDGRLWQGVVDRLSDRFRCIAPDWPFGAQQVPMSPDADLSPPGIARLIADFLAKLELEDVTIVGNDSGGAISQVLVTTHPDRIGRLALTNCDTHENFPPKVFRPLPPVAKLPGGIYALAAPFRIKPVGRMAFAPFARTRIPDEWLSEWIGAATHSKDSWRDLKKVTEGLHRRHTEAAAQKLRGSQLPIHMIWGADDRFFPISYAERLAGEAGNARVVPVAEAKTFVPLDQPTRVAEEIAEFAGSG
jgi:pimeloyl-ACP methyl ester carboxylesterase